MLGIPEQLVYREYMFFNCLFDASITLLSFSTNLQYFFYKVMHHRTPNLYLEIEMLLIDRLSVFSILEISNLF